MPFTRYQICDETHDTYMGGNILSIHEDIGTKKNSPWPYLTKLTAHTNSPKILILPSLKIPFKKRQEKTNISI